jgi:transcription antitermination protein NusB
MSRGIRRRGRELSLKIIYSLHDHEEPVDKVLDDFWSNFRFREDVLGEPADDAEAPLPFEVRRFTEEVTRGVYGNIEKIDEVIREFSTNWALDRMARVDLSLLRLATFELLFRPEIPASVVINEAIEIGKRYGTKDTPSFVNGILDKISRTYRPASS